MHPAQRVLWAFTVWLLSASAVNAQPGITVPAGGPPWNSFQAQNTRTVIFTFTRDPALGTTQFLIAAPAAGATYTITKNGAPCPIGNAAGCSGSDASPPVGIAGNFEVIGLGEAAGVATFVVRVDAATAGNWQINPGTNASFTAVHVVPDVVVDFPAVNASGAAGIALNASGSLAVVQPPPAPALTSVTFNQTSGPAVTLSTSGPLNEIATFAASTVTVPTDLVFEVTINDGTLSSTELVTVTVSPPAQPVDAVLAIDTSGSMGWHRTGSALDLTGGCCSRLMSAKLAARLFVERLGALADDSRTGVAIFPGEPSPSAVLARRFTPASGLATAAQFPSIRTDIGEETVTCGTCNPPPTPASAGTPKAGSVPVNWNGTPTSAGLTEARTMINTAAAAGTRTKVILLVSDGAWNKGTDPANAAFLAPFVTDGIRIFTLGMGTPGADDVNHSSLQDISVATGVGTALNPIGSTAFNFGEPASEPNLVPYFEKIMSSMVSLNFASDPTSTIAPGQTKSHTALVTALDSAVSFTLSWESSRRNLLGFAVESPSGTTFQPTTSDNGYHNVTIGKEVLSQPQNQGAWTLHVVSPPIKDIGTVSYTYSVITRSALELQTRLDKDRYFTGSPMIVEARLLENNRRRPGADVKLEIRRPESAIGAFHAKHTISANQFAQIPAVVSDEPLTPLQRKNIFLQQSKIFPPKVVPVPTLTLLDDGRPPDRQAGDGIYTARFTGFDVPGLYRFRIVATGETSAGQNHQRETEIQEFVQIALTPELLLAGISAGAVRISAFMPDDLRKRLTGPVSERSVRRMVTLRPRDARRNPLGPGYLDQFRFDAQDAEVLGAFDHLNGDYSVIFEYPRGTRPTMVVSLDETFGEVKSAPVDVQTGRPVGKDKKLPWWLWVIIVVGAAIGVLVGAM